MLTNAQPATGTPLELCAALEAKAGVAEPEVVLALVVRLRRAMELLDLAIAGEDVSPWFAGLVRQFAEENQP